MQFLIIFCLIFLAALMVSASNDTRKSVNIAGSGYPYIIDEEGSAPVYKPGLANGKSNIKIKNGSIALIEWKKPRDISAIALFGPVLPKPQDITLQYWNGKWPEGGTTGWSHLDDPYNGQWLTIKPNAIEYDNCLMLKFPPLCSEENPNAGDVDVIYRQTYKIRIIFSSSVIIRSIEAYSTAEWRNADIIFNWKPNAKMPTPWQGKIEAHNAMVLSQRPANEENSQFCISVRYAYTPERTSSERGFLTFRSRGWDSFSVYIDDIVREGGIYIRDIDAFLSDASKNIAYKDWQKQRNAWDSTIMEKVARMPEQTLERAMARMPALKPRECYIGLPHQRMEFEIGANGDVCVTKRVVRGPGSDINRCPGDRYLIYSISTCENPVFDINGGREVTRYLEEGYLPVIHTEWQSDNIYYEQAAIATILEGNIFDLEKRKGDEPTLLLDKIEITNTSNEHRNAYLWLHINQEVPLSLTSDGILEMAHPTDGKQRPGLTPVRAKIDIQDKGELTILHGPLPSEINAKMPEDANRPNEVIKYKVSLNGHEKHTIYISIPSVELLTDKEIQALKDKHFKTELHDVLAFWKKFYDSSMEYEVPSKELTDLFKANLWHVLITTDKDPKTGLLQHYAGTVKYDNYANETCMVVRSLETRGLHEEARKYLQPFIEGQGKKVFPGNFKSSEGVFHAAYPYPENDPYTALGYNMNHGWVLWGLCEHYFWTRDKADIMAIIPNIISACDWIIKERQATKVLNPDGTKPIEWGLAPAGQLEDVEEFLYFYSTNAYYFVGLKTAAEVLRDIGHPEAERIGLEAKEYKKDILESIRRATAETPVIRLLDGSYIPYVPHRAYVTTHLKEGWIREGLYSSLHLLDAGIFRPNDIAVTWLLQNLEDNIFVSRESGYGIEDLESNFFDLGGFTKQPCLLSNSTAHLMRDEIPNQLRVLWNTFAASYYRDTRCFAEWVRHLGEGGGPLYKTPDEAKFCNYLRNMLVYEDGNTLWLGMGVPKNWMDDGKSIQIKRAATFFGQMDMSITSHISQGFVKAEISAPNRNQPNKILLRIRHPEARPMKEVFINGRDWKKFDVHKELITLPIIEGKIEVIVNY